VHYVEGNIFESPAQTLVNTVNTVGAMGKGLAREFKRLFPEMFEEYQKLCEARKLQIGKLWLYPTPHKWVLNFPTKKHWRYPSKLEYIEQGLKAFVSNYNNARISSVAFPQLGCGHGELDWLDVKPLMESYLRKLPIDIYIYEVNRYTFPEHRDVKRMREWLLSEPASYPFNEFKADLQLLLVQKTTFKDLAGDKFRAKNKNEFIEISQDNKSVLIPWRGDESGFGILELWQYFREKGMCTEHNIAQMGFQLPGLIIALLRQLSYIQQMTLLGRNASPAVQLKPSTRVGDLFTEEEPPREHLRI
jgi:O-acetyl-ADP-ribose deacetylase (regulator of RNase III)